MGHSCLPLHATFFCFWPTTRYYELLKLDSDASSLLGGGSPAGYSAIASNAAAIWERLPKDVQERLHDVLKNFWRKFVPKGGDSGVEVRTHTLTHTR